jgi:formate-dependent phosphoribosylglycinamide formyltransferase (GAR transformylase)
MWTTPVKRLVGFTDIIKRVNELNFGREMLVVIGGGVLQYETFVECANKGISTILVDNDENCYCFGVCNHFIKASTREPFKINLKLKEFLSTHVGSKIIGVYTQGCDVELTVSQLAGQFNLPGIKQKSAFFCNNKIEFRNLMAASYIDQPEYGYTDNLEESRVIARQLGFPCVFKSVDNCASRGLTIVSDCESVEPAFKTALRNSVDQRVLIDRFIEGKEYSVDTIIYKGKVYPAGISDREFSKSEGHAIQTGSLTPSLLPTDKQENIRNHGKVRQYYRSG